jgi:hypothetical protein
MYQVTNLFRRASTETPWFQEAGPENASLNCDYTVAEESADGYCGRSDHPSKNGRRITARIFWRDVAAFNAFTAESAAKFAEFLTTRTIYYAANGITHEVHQKALPATTCGPA